MTLNRVLIQIKISHNACKRGAMSIVMLWVVVLILLLGVFAVDMGRHSLLGGQLSMATINSVILDKATLSDDVPQREKLVGDVIKYSLSAINKGDNVKKTTIKITDFGAKSNKIYVGVTPKLLVLDKFLNKLEVSTDTSYNNAEIKIDAMEIVLVLDTSSSMAGDMNSLKTSVRQFLDYLEDMRNKGAIPFVNVGIVAFNKNSGVVMGGNCYTELPTLVVKDADMLDSQYKLIPKPPHLDSDPNILQNCDWHSPLIGDYRILHQKINTLSSGGTTSGASGLYWAGKMLSPFWAGRFGTPIANYSAVVKKQVIFFTDGAMNVLVNQTIPACDAIKAKNSELYAIGIGRANKQTLNRCATSLQHSLYSSTASGLKKMFDTIFRRMIQSITLTK